MDHEKLASELVKSLRGNRSQAALSRRLGFNTNVVYTWEAGRRFPMATDFMALALRVKVHVNGGLQQFWGTAQPQPLLADAPSLQSITALLLALRQGQKVAHLARRSGIHRLTLVAWLSGRTQPRLPDLLRFVEAATQRLLDFVAIFVDPSALPSARSMWRDLFAQRRVAYELPWSHAVLRALEIGGQSTVTQTSATLASQLGIREEHAQECLQALIQAKQVRRVKSRYVLERVITVDTRVERARNVALKAHWLRTALERIAEEKAENVYSYSLLALSHQDYERIRALHAEFFEQVRAIARSSTSSERVMLVNVQILELAR